MSLCPSGKTLLVREDRRYMLAGRSQHQSPTSCVSANGQYLIENANCAEHYNVDAFKILSRGRSIKHLGILEATFIFPMDPCYVGKKSLSAHFAYLCKEEEEHELVSRSQMLMKRILQQPYIRGSASDSATSNWRAEHWTGSSHLDHWEVMTHQ